MTGDWDDFNCCCLLQYPHWTLWRDYFMSRLLEAAFCGAHNGNQVLTLSQATNAVNVVWHDGLNDKQFNPWSLEFRGQPSGWQFLMEPDRVP